MKNRQSIRLKNYDYTANGAYFVTICTHNRECSLGEIVNGEMVVNELGKIVGDEWIKSSQIRHEIELDAWVVMPNHFHAIVFIRRGDRPVALTIPHDSIMGGAPTGPKNESIGALMAGFKSAVTKRMNIMRNTPRVPVWQRNYYEHIIRNKKSLNQIRDYIQNNPLQWQWDENNPDNNKEIMLNVQTL